jgi:hypothetical protein
MGPIKTLLTMFATPEKSFEAIRNRSMVALPLTFSIVSAVFILYWYYEIVNFDWFQDNMTATVSDPTARDMAKKIMTKNMLSTVSAAGIFFGIPLMYAGMALYFLLISKIKNISASFGQWFAFVAWASVPSLLSLPLGAMQILLSQDGMLTPEQLNPTSVNQIFFHFPVGHPWQVFLDSANVLNVWSAVLMVIGLQVWTKQSRTRSVVVVLAPYTIIGSCWVAYICLSSAA